MEELITKPHVFRIRIEAREFSRSLEAINAKECLTGFDNLNEAKKWIKEHAKNDERYVILDMYSI